MLLAQAELSYGWGQGLAGIGLVSNSQLHWRKGGGVRTTEDSTLILLLIAVSLAFAWILWPFFGAILWAIVFATVFAPVHRRVLATMRQSPNMAALTTLLLIVAIALLPSTLTAMSVVQEATTLYEKIESGEVDFGRFISQLLNALPAWAADLLTRLGISDLGDVQTRLSSALREGSQFLATQAIAIGQGTAHIIISFFLMLYLLFFFLRDGSEIAQRLKDAIPLRTEQKRALFSKFAIVIRAMFKGTLLVAALQGMLGGIIFWFLGIPAAVLWGVVMALLSLLPAVGAALIWLPVALYLLATGAVWQGLVLIAYGALVIGLVDNLLRPILIGMDTKLPDYIVLISTLGGIAIFGLNGFVIGPVIAAMFIATWDRFSTGTQTTKKHSASK
jgi:predicted PurR-regulated permease PerM